MRVCVCVYLNVYYTYKHVCKHFWNRSKEIFYIICLSIHMYVEGAMSYHVWKLEDNNQKSVLSFQGPSSAIRLVASCFYLLRVHAVTPPHLLVYFHRVFYAILKFSRFLFLVIGKQNIQSVLMPLLPRS